MTREEYEQRVLDAANSILTEVDAAEWKEKNPDGTFWDFQDDFQNNGGDFQDRVFTTVDSTCEPEWKGAVEVLRITGQDPDQVDSGIYEGCNWKKILVILACECYSWDIDEKMEKLFESGTLEDYMIAIPSNQRQIGHFPEIQQYRIPIEPWTIEMHPGIKILIHGVKVFPDLSVVFEGVTEKRERFYIVRARRVYTQGGPDADIQEDLKRCKEELGVELFPQGSSTDG